jgi:hypothetical protein
MQFLERSRIFCGEKGCCRIGRMFDSWMNFIDWDQRVGLEVGGFHSTSPYCCGRITAGIADGIYIVAAAACAAEVKTRRGGFGGRARRGATETVVG